ncbi:MAG: response regulator [Nitrospirota bacterium]|nr:response regulator [Nitrospirota bacterium]
MEPMIAPENGKPTILIVEDEAGPRNALKMILRPFFHLYAVDNAHAALRLLKEQPVDLVTLDLKLPDRPGVELLREIKLEHEDMEVIIITGYGSLKSALDGLRYGAAGYLLKPFNVTELVNLIKQILAKKQRLDQLRNYLKQPVLGRTAVPDLADAWRRMAHQYAEASSVPHMDARFGRYSHVVGFLSDVLEATSRELLIHSSRVSFYATRMGGHLRLTDHERTSLMLGALLHDIGMVGIAGHTPGQADPIGTPLPEGDKRHTELGVLMLAPFELPAETSQIIAYHHELFDGSGYPEGLQGEGIPFPARIVSIAQGFDQMMAASSPQTTGSVDEALKQLRAQAGTRFDPALIEPLARIMSDSTASFPPFAPAPSSAILPET